MNASEDARGDGAEGGPQGVKREQQALVTRIGRGLRSHIPFEDDLRV